jgi:hypothetical protein
MTSTIRPVMDPTSCLADPELGRDHGDRRALGVPVQRDRVPLELIGAIRPCHLGWIISLPPGTSRD